MFPSACRPANQALGRVNARSCNFFTRSFQAFSAAEMSSFFAGWFFGHRRARNKSCPVVPKPLSSQIFLPKNNGVEALIAQSFADGI